MTPAAVHNSYPGAAMFIVRVAFAVGIVAGLAGMAPAKPDRATVDAAVAKAAAYLRASHKPGDGAAAVVAGTGPSSLVGLALLEAGTRTDDPSVQAITKLVRGKAAAETGTYSVSLAVLYLDRLGDSRDVGLIQLLGTRLYAGMLIDGGFGYTCPDLPGLGAGVLAGTVPPPEPPKPAPPKRKPEKDGFLPVPDKPAPKKPAEPGANRLHPSVAPVNAAVRRLIAANGRLPAGRDNSNTQFGLIGLWVAARHGVPMDDAFALLEAGFLLTQNRTDGGWPYSPGGVSTPAMTCAGLLGLAVGASRRSELVAGAAPVVPAGDNPFDDPPKKPDAPKQEGGQRGAAVAAGLTHVGNVLRAAAPPDGLAPYVGLGDVYYTLWSVERVAMAYGLDTIGDVDWYTWGCGFLLPKQQPSGAWSVGNTSVNDDVSTAFAVLFLLRSNFVADLTSRVKGKVKDPGRAVLKGGQGFRPPDQPDAGENRPAAPAPPADPDKLAADLVDTAEFPTLLRTLRDAKGGEYTQALVRAIPKLPPEKQTQARDALAERLTRMTAKTLKGQLADADSELRLGAARACGPKGDKAVVGALIDRVTDLSEPVGQAARVSLKTLTAQDFGPEPGASAAAKAQSLAAWKRWLLASGLGG